MLAHRLLIAGPTVLMFLGDCILTITGQTAAWWQTKEGVQEADPIIANVLSGGSIVYYLFSAFWLFLILAVSAFNPKAISLLWNTTMVIGHSFGIMTWLLYHHNQHIVIIYLLFLVTAITIVFQCWYFDRKIRYET